MKITHMRIIGKVASASDVKWPHSAVRVASLEYDVPRGRAWAHVTDCYGNKDAVKVELPSGLERLQVRDVLEVEL